MFSKNLKDLLLAAPAGPRVTHGPRSRHPHRRARSPSSTPPARCSTRPRSTRTSRSNDWNGSLATLAALCAEAQGRAHRHRQRHRQPRDRQARRRADEEDAAAQADQGHGVGGRRLGLFGLRAGGAGVPRSRRVAARRRLDRAAPAGPAGRAGQDRAQGDRRRPVPARRRPDRRSPARSTPWSRTA